MPDSELWTLGNKAGILAYLLLAQYGAHAGNPAFFILMALLYAALAVTAAIFHRREQPRRAAAGASALFLLISMGTLDPAFVLLLPMAIWELVPAGRDRWKTAGIASALLGFLVPKPFFPAYLLTAGLTALLQGGVERFASRMMKQETDLDQMKDKLSFLNRSLRENHELLRQSSHTVKLEERNRLSQQIHDDLGHSMAGALIQMEAARRLMGQNRERADVLLANAITISREGLDRIRLTLKDVKPRSEELGVQRLRMVVERIASEHLIQATLSFSGDMGEVTSLQWKVIQQNAVEAMTNAVRYSGGTAVHLEVRVLNRFVKAAVSDNGRGAEKVVKGMGILGMEERAAALGGTVTVDGANGFTVTTLLPRDGQHAAPGHE